MWCYKLRYFEEGSYYNAEGIVIGLDMSKAIERLQKYYGEEAIDDIHMTLIEDHESVLDFRELSNVRYTTFFPEEN